MNFCVLVKISKYSLSVWHQSGTGLYLPFSKSDNNVIPLYFYVNGNDFLFGKQARDRFYINDPNAFGNYFEIIKETNKSFNYFNNQKPIKQLLYISIERLLSDFIKNELFRCESLEELRSNFPLRFIYEADIEDKEKTLVETLFLDAGYNNIERYELHNILLEVLINNDLIPDNNPILILEGIDNNLYLNLFHSIQVAPIAYEKLEGSGADPRLNILSELIIEYILAQNPFLLVDKEKEIAYMLPHISYLIDSPGIVKGEIELSNGTKYWFRVNKHNIEERLLYDTGDVKIYRAIDNLLKSNGIKSDNLNILLVSDGINTSYFKNKLLKKYPSVKGVEPNHFTEVMKLIFSRIIESNYSVTKKITKPPVLPPPSPSSISEKNGLIRKIPILPPKPDKKKENIVKNKPAIPELKQKNKEQKKIELPPLPQKK